MPFSLLIVLSMAPQDLFWEISMPGMNILYAHIFLAELNAEFKLKSHGVKKFSNEGRTNALVFTKF